MKNLFRFLVRNSVILLFIALEVLSIILLVQNNEYPKSATFSSVNQISSASYSFCNSIVDYFRLHTENEMLVSENAKLKEQVINLQESFLLINDSTNVEQEFSVIPAKIVNYTTNRQKNYITINRGAKDGVEKDMGVVCQDGAVGIVVTVSDHYALVIPIINNALTISCRLKDDGYIGTLQWDGRNHHSAQLMDISRHIPIHKGDTIITSGVSAIFPGGILIGTIKDYTLSDSDASYHIVVSLSTDFGRLQNVEVLKRTDQEEINDLEKTINR